MSNLRLQAIELIAQNPKGVGRLIFKHTGFKPKTTPEAVISAYTIAGQPFLMDLFNMFASYEGYDQAEPSPEVAKEKNNIWTQFKGFWDDVTNFVSNTNTNVTGINNLVNPNNEGQQQIQTDINNKSNILLYAGIGTILLLIIIIIFKR